MPPTSPEYLAYTLEELFIEFMEDTYESPPPGGLPMDSGDDVVFKTDDPVVNKWEEQWAKGETPDLDAILTPEEQAKFRAQADAVEESGFDDSYRAVDDRLDAGVTQTPDSPTTKRR